MEPGRYGLPGNPERRYHFPVHPTNGVLFCEGIKFVQGYAGPAEIARQRATFRREKRCEERSTPEPLGRRQLGEGSDGKELGRDVCVVREQCIGSPIGDSH